MILLQSILTSIRLLLIMSAPVSVDPVGVSSPDEADFHDCDSVDDAKRVGEEAAVEGMSDTSSPSWEGEGQKTHDGEDQSSDDTGAEQARGRGDNEKDADVGASSDKEGPASTDTPSEGRVVVGVSVEGVGRIENGGTTGNGHDEGEGSNHLPSPVSAVPVMPPPSESSANESGLPSLGEDPVEVEKKIKKQMTWGESWRSLTLAPRAAGVMMKVPIRRMFRKPKRRTWNTQMETYISVMRSAGKNAPRHDLRAVRAIANTTIPNVLLPSGVFRCKQYIAFQERDSDNRLHQPVKIDWIWPKRVTPERDQSSHVLKDCPTKEELQRNTVILYVHGGGFCLCSTGTHRHLLYTLALKTENCILCCVNYRQPPESTLIESTSDVECMYRYLISNMGVSPERIAIAGDSAGGDMVVLALVQLRDKRIPLPGCACLLSPWVDLTDKVDYFEQTPQQTPRKLPGSESVTSRGRRKSSGGRRRRSSNDGVSSYTCVDYIPADLVVEFAQLAIGDISADDPRISAMYADLRGLPHMLIHAGQAELLLPQIERFAAKFSAQKSESVELQYREFEDMVHVFQLFSFCCGPDEAPNRSLSDIADFIQRHTQVYVSPDEANPLS